MNAGHTHVIDRFNPAPHHLRRHSRFFRNWNIHGAGCNDQHVSEQWPLGIADRHHARLVMIYRSTVEPFDNRGDLASRARRQQGAMMFQQSFRNGADLDWRLPLLSLIHISEPTRLLSISYAV